MAHDAGHGHGEGHGSNPGSTFLKWIGIIVIGVLALLGFVATFADKNPIIVDTNFGALVGSSVGVRAEPPFRRPPRDNLPPGWSVQR